MTAPSWRSVAANRANEYGSTTSSVSATEFASLSSALGVEPKEVVLNIAAHEVRDVEQPV